MTAESEFLTENINEFSFITLCFEFSCKICDMSLLLWNNLAYISYTWIWFMSIYTWIHIYGIIAESVTSYMEQDNSINATTCLSVGHEIAVQIVCSIKVSNSLGCPARNLWSPAASITRSIFGKFLSAAGARRERCLSLPLFLSFNRQLMPLNVAEKILSVLVAVPKLWFFRSHVAVPQL